MSENLLVTTGKPVYRGQPWGNSKP